MYNESMAWHCCVSSQIRGSLHRWIKQTDEVIFICLTILEKGHLSTPDNNTNTSLEPTPHTLKAVQCFTDTVVQLSLLMIWKQPSIIAFAVSMMLTSPLHPIGDLNACDPGLTLSVLFVMGCGREARAQSTEQWPSHLLLVKRILPTAKNWNSA